MMNILRLIVFAIVMLALAGIANGQSKVIAGSPKLTDTNEFRAYNNVFDRGVSINYGSAMGGKFTNMGNVLELRNDSIQLPGTVSIISGSRTVNGHSTEFDRTFRKGEYIEIAGVSYRMINLDNDTTMTVDPAPSVTLSGVAYNNPTKREIMTISGTGKVKIGNDGSPVTSTPFFNIFNTVYTGYGGKWSSNTGLGSFLNLATDTAVTNNSLQIASQHHLIISGSNKATYTSESGVVGNHSEVQVLNGATGGGTRMISHRIHFHNESPTFTIARAYGMLMDSLRNSGTITGAAGIAVDRFSSASNQTLMLLGTEYIPTGNWAIHDSSGFASYLRGSITTGGLDNYGSNIAGSYTSRSKVDKNYVDSLVANSSSGVTSVSGTSPISVATGTTTPVISMTAASSTDAGYITTGTQTISGDKTFSGTINPNAISLSSTVVDPGNSNIRPIVATRTVSFTTSAYTGSFTNYLGSPIIAAGNTQNWSNAGNSSNGGGLAGFTWNPTTLSGSTGTITLSTGFMSSYAGAATGASFTTIRNFYTRNPSGSNAITNLIGFYCDQLTRGSNNVGYLYGTATTGNYAFYNSTSDAVNLGTGTTTAGTLKITVAEYADNTAAAAALAVGTLYYRTGHGLDIVR